MATLTGNTIASTYTGLLSVTGAVGADTVEAVTDGAGTSTSLSLSQQRATITLGSGAADDFIVDGTTLVVEGDNNRVGIGTASPATTLDVTGNATITTSDNSNTLSLISTDADANSGPNLLLYRNSSSPADNDTNGYITFQGRNDNSQDVVYSAVESYVTDVSDGTEDAELNLRTMVAGTLQPRISMHPSEVIINDGSIDSDFRVESDGNTHMLFVDAGNNRVGIGDSSPSQTLSIDVNSSTTTSAGANGIEIGNSNTTADNMAKLGFSFGTGMGSMACIAGKFDDRSGGSETVDLIFGTIGAGSYGERMVIKGSGNVGVGTTSPTSGILVVRGSGDLLTLESTNSGTGGAQINLNHVGGSQADGDSVGRILFNGQDSNDNAVSYARIDGIAEDVTDGSENGALNFDTRTSNSAFSTKMHITSAGNVGIKETSPDSLLHISDVGDNNHCITMEQGGRKNAIGNFYSSDATNSRMDFYISDGNTNGGSNVRMRLLAGGELMVNRDSNPGGVINSNTMDGRWGIVVDDTYGNDALIDFRDGGSSIGNITIVSGNVSYNTFIGSHYSSLTTDNEDDIEIGTVLSTIDETHTRHLAKFKVSDVVGDTRVYGVFAGWDAMYEGEGTQATISALGATEIRVTGACAGGDLLESNGDGTAKVQDDDIIRSKTIGKVTIGDSDTGVKLVSCVLYCG